MFEPVLREIEYQAQLFDKVIWLCSGTDFKSTVFGQVTNPKIELVLMPSVRHKALNALFVLLAYPVFIFYILKYLSSATHVHTRGPSHPALLGICISFFDKGRTYWHKYAGNWVADKAPFTYKLQKKWLQKLRHTNIRTTVNGTWNETNKQIMSLENPCITEIERINARAIADGKSFEGNIKILFAGGLNAEKGILELLAAFEKYTLPSTITDLFIVGQGPLYQTLQNRIVSVTGVNVHLPGSLSRAELDKYYSAAHLLVLPSVSEGFPKVVAEAAAFGCVPIVTDISAISQYIVNGESGILLPDNKPETIAETFRNLPEPAVLKKMSGNATAVSSRFTYESYLHRMQNEIWTTAE